jgi:hypothetical protein
VELIQDWLYLCAGIELSEYPAALVFINVLWEKSQGHSQEAINLLKGAQVDFLNAPVSSII